MPCFVLISPHETTLILLVCFSSIVLACSFKITLLAIIVICGASSGKSVKGLKAGCSAAEISQGIKIYKQSVSKDFMICRQQRR